jgi:pilus assembly protein CpaF
MELPVRAIREQMASAFDVVVHQARFKDGSRLITHVTEVVGIEADSLDTIELRELFAFDFSAGYDDSGRPQGRLNPTETLDAFLDKLGAAGVHLKPALVRADAG